MAQDSDTRDGVIIKTSIVGIVTNIALASLKAVIGLAANSIAIVLDAVNNLSDALSSIVTIAGTKLANKLPDRKHPFGYGRIEYLSAMTVAAIILYAGITSAVESIKKIISPENADYSTTSLIIIAIAIVVKLILGRYVTSQGKKVNSSSLVASGADATFDAVLSASVLGSALIFIYFGLALEAYVGVVISAFIIKSGVEIMRGTVDEILGVRANKEVTDRIKKMLCEEPPVRGAYDLIMYNYGPEKNYASVHLELPDNMTVEEVDRLTRKLEKKVYQKSGVILAGVGVYSFITKDDEASAIREHIKGIVTSHDWAIQLHGFYADLNEKEIRFDVVLSFEINPKEGLQIIYDEVQAAYPDFELQISPDVDFSNS